jgi:hypothetical protein
MNRPRASSLVALVLLLAPVGARAQYPYGYGYGYGPGYNVPVIPGFGAVYGGSTYGSYGYGLNRTYTTFGAATGIVPRVVITPATLPPGVYPVKPTRRGYVVPGGAVAFPPARAPLGGNLRGALPNPAPAGGAFVPGVLPGRPR